MFDNKVIKSVKKEDGPKIIEYLKSQGVNTRGHKGLYCENNDGNSHIYYGVIDGYFDNYNQDKLLSNVQILDLNQILEPSWEW